MSERKEPKAEQGSLEADLARLEAIVKALEAENLDLDGALGLFEEGVTRLKQARSRIAAAELRLGQLREAAGGEPKVEDLER